MHFECASVFFMLFSRGRLRTFVALGSPSFLFLMSIYLSPFFFNREIFAVSFLSSSSAFRTIQSNPFLRHQLIDLPIYRQKIVASTCRCKKSPPPQNDAVTRAPGKAARNVSSDAIVPSSVGTTASSPCQKNASTYSGVEEKEAATERRQGGSQPSDDAESVAVVFPEDEVRIRWDPSRLGKTVPSFASAGPSSAAAASSPAIPSPSSQETELTKRDGEWTGSRTPHEGNISPFPHFSEGAKSVGFHDDGDAVVDGKETGAEAGAALTSPGEWLTEENYHHGRTTAESGDRNGGNLFGPPPATPMMQPVLTSRACLEASQRSRVGWDPARTSFQAQAPRARTPRAVQYPHTFECDVAVTTPRAGDASASSPPLSEISAGAAVIAASSAERGLVAPARQNKTINCSAARIEDKAKTVPAPLQWEALEDEAAAVPVERDYVGGCATGDDLWGGEGMESRSGWTRSVRGTSEKGVPQALLSLRAALLYASEQRGIDLAKWFLLDGGGERDGDGGTLFFGLFL